MLTVKYKMLIRWGWSQFNEETHSVLFNLDELDREVRAFLDRVADRYTYDCGRKDHPLHPRICSITLTPYTETIEVPYEKIEQFQEYLEAKGKEN